MTGGINWAKVVAEVGSALIICAAVLSSLPYKRKKISVVVMFALNLGFYVCVQHMKEIGGVGLLFAPLLDISFSFVTIGLFTKGIIWKNYLIFFLTVQCCNVGTVAAFLIFKSCAQAMADAALGNYSNVQGIAIATVASVLMTITMGCLFRRLLHPEVYDRERLYKTIDIVLVIGNVAEYYFRINFSNYLKLVTDKGTLIGILSQLFMTVGLVLTLNVAAGVYNRSERKRIQREKALLESLAAENYDHYQKLANENRELQELGKNHSTQAVRKYAEKLRKYGQELSGFPLSGNMTVDALLCRYSRDAAKYGVQFDAVVEPLLDIPVSEVELISIFEYLMRAMYNAVCEEQNSRWMSVKLRFRNGMMLLIVEGNASQLNRSREDRRCIRLVREMTENHSGVLIQTKDTVQVFIPSTGIV